MRLGGAELRETLEGGVALARHLHAPGGELDSLLAQLEVHVEEPAEGGEGLLKRLSLRALHTSLAVHVCEDIRERVPDIPALAVEGEGRLVRHREGRGVRAESDFESPPWFRGR